MDYLVLFPTVFVESGDSTVLLYNATLKKSLLINNDIVVKCLKDRLNDYLNIFELCSDVFKNSESKEIIQTIETECFGWIGNGSTPPIQPAPFIQINGLTNTNSNELKNELDYFSLYELSICVKGDLSSSTGTLWTSYSQKELDLNLLEIFLKNAYLMSNLKRINIYGDNLKEYRRLNEVVQILIDNCPKIEEIVIHCSIDDVAIICETSIKTINLCKFVVTIDGDTTLDYYAIIRNNHQISNFIFRIRTSEDVSRYSYLIQSAKSQIKPCPIISEDNTSFIKDLLSMTSTDLLLSNKTSKEILLNSRINLNYYGEMIISSNGDIYSSLHEKPCGNIIDKKIEEATYLLQSTSKLWYLVRDNIPSCQNCPFKHLCPPISYYELILNDYCLCDIKN